MWLKLKKNPWFRLAIGAAIAFFCVSAVLTLHRYYSFYASYDQGIFNQVFWNGSHGRFFQSSLSSALSTNVVHQGELPTVYYHRLGQHFTPALLLWLPLYALFPSPVTLTVLQVTLVTAAGLVLYVLARHYVNEAIAAFITISFYGANAVLGPTWGNFHDICQIPLYTFTLLLAMEKRWWWLFWLMAVVLLMVREDSGIGLFGVGVYMVLSRRFPRRGLAVCALSFGYILILTNLIMPLFSEDISERFMIERFGQYAEGDEASTLEIIWGILSNPLRLIGELFTPLGRTIAYLLGQWLPLAFVPAASGAAWSIAGFPLLKLFIARGQSVLSINIRYALTVVPGLFYGAILWWSVRPQLFEKTAVRQFWTFCIALSVLITISANPNRTLSFLVPDSIDPWVKVSLSRQWEHARAIYPLLDRVPEDASVSATTYIVPHLSSRREILRFPKLELVTDEGTAERMEYVLVDLWRLNTYQVAFKHDRARLKVMVPKIENLVASGEYGLLELRDGVVFLERGASSNPEALQAWETYRGELRVESSQHRPLMLHQRDTERFDAARSRYSAISASGEEGESFLLSHN
ncbi:hypothetical protein AY599_22580 [Leptolyngbya valderiana BDU 20041]|nr:DUF2079 domain-containing protein [Geitlerinema sp. CS-897]OAB59893.1 hypothetical protein AY599_22580 [Leptolyngbya valderiana BDU 20041]